MLKFFNKKEKTSPQYSLFDEAKIIDEYIGVLNIDVHEVVDIGASDGTSMSNSYALYNKGWKGLAFECDDEKFIKLATVNKKNAVKLIKDFVTPLNGVDYLLVAGVSSNFGVLSLDIDGYDYFVLESILKRFRPQLICAEINEKVPAPLKFSVLYDPDYRWDQSHFYGQSISQVEVLCREFDYGIVKLEWNNIFIAPLEKCRDIAVSAEEAYRLGYKNRAGRKEKFYYNADIDAALDMAPEKAIEFFNEYFANYEGKYSMSI